MTKNYIAALVLLLATALPGSAINPYRRYDTRNGLSDNSVKDICQDSRGYMWFATKDGFNRFNGYRFDVFGSSFSGEHLNIDVICPHSDGIRIWLGCTEALMLFDPRDERLTRFDARNSEGKGIRNCISLLYDPLGDLWIGTDDGLFRWDERIGRLFRYELEESDGGTCRGIRTIFEDNGGEIWVGTTAGLYRYHRKTDRFGRNAKPKPESSLLGDNEITAIVEAEDGKLLIGMQNGYLGEFDIYTGRFTQFPAFDAEGKQLSVARIHTIFRRDMNRYMIGSDSGLFFFSRKNGRWSVSGDNLAEESIYRCFRDREGGIWIGTYFCGVNYLSPRQDEILWYYDDGRPESLDGNAVSQFCDDGRGNLWIATENGGLNHFDVRNRKFTNHTARSHNNLHALCMDGDDLLIGTFSQGLDLMNLRTGKVVNYRNVPGDSASLCNDYVYAIFRASDGTLYVGTMSGMCTFDKRRGRFSRVKITEGRFIYDIAEDTGGNIWVASKVSGIYRYSPGDGTWKNYRHDELDPRSPADDRYIRVYVDTGGQVWFCGESAGICRYDPPMDGFENFGADDNLPNGIYYGVLDDSAGNLWLSSNQGILKYNPQLHTCARYTIEDGLQSNQFNFRSSHKAGDGTFFFGGINGFNYFSPFNISVNKVRPEIVISSVRMHRADSFSVGSERQTLPDGNLRISSKTISFDINFECLSYVAPGQNRYAWKLEGFNSDWVYTDQHSVSFMKLPAGRYVFRVRGCNNDGYWSDATRSLEMSIQPHPFLSPVAKGVYFLLVALLIVAAVRVILRRQGEKKEKELIQTKMAFFTQVAHEIKTPVTLIKSPLERIIETGKWNSDVTSNLDMMKRNVDRLLELIRQLLDFRKVDNEGFRLSRRETDISLLVEETVARFRNSTEKIAIRTDCPDAHVLFYADGEAFTKILSNLLANALKYARSTVVVVLRILDDDRGRTLRLSVRDDGDGIPPRIREKVFDLFYQKNPDSGKGFGIGLSLVKLLVEKHNGRVYVDRHTVAGCELTVEIPDSGASARGGVRAPEPAEEPADSPEDRQPEAKPFHIMVVEDTPDLREFLVKNFEDTYGVLSAKNGAEALAILEKQACDLIISDALMPEMDGFDLLMKVRNDEMLCHIPFILLSVVDSVDSKIKGLEYGADVYIEKPFSLGYVKATVESLLENRKRAFRHFASRPGFQYEKDDMGRNDRQWLDKLTGIVRENLTCETLSVDLLTEKMALSRSSLQRKLKGLTGVSPNEYIQLVRLKTAAQLLRSGEYRISEVCYLTGFSSMSWFAKCFTKQFGMRPKDFIRQNQDGKSSG